MARILHNEEWYDELGSGSLYEAEFERIFCHHVPSVYPGYVAVPFKKTVFSEDGSARADLALIREDYGEWWVVEVERANHSLRSHVLPQIRTLAHARYTLDEARYLAQTSAVLSESSLADMLRGEQPRVLVVVDAPRARWEAPLAEHGAKLALFQIFRSDRGRYMVRLNGYHPSVDRAPGALCALDPVLPNLLLVRSPAILPNDRTAPVRVFWRGQLTVWRRIDTEDRVWIAPQGRVTLDPRLTYELRPYEGALLLQKAPQQRR